MPGTLLHPAGERDLVTALVARVAELEAAVSSLASLAADAYRAEGQAVPPQFAAALPLPEGSRPRHRLRSVS
jgi:hypothetical protein